MSRVSLVRVGVDLVDVARFKLLLELVYSPLLLRPLLAAQEASAAPAAAAPSERASTNPQRWVAQQRAALATKVRGSMSGSMWPKREASHAEDAQRNLD